GWRARVSPPEPAAQPASSAGGALAAAAGRPGRRKPRRSSRVSAAALAAAVASSGGTAPPGKAGPEATGPRPAGPGAPPLPGPGGGQRRRHHLEERPSLGLRDRLGVERPRAEFGPGERVQADHTGTTDLLPPRPHPDRATPGPASLPNHRRLTGPMLLQAGRS